MLQEILHINRAQARRALRRAGNDLKAAIVMQRSGLPRSQAAALLRRQGGRIA